MGERVYLSLGCNLGDRLANLRRAVAELRELDRTRLIAYSSVYETEPVGKTDQPLFLNMAVEIETDLEPLELLNAAKAIEGRMGRVLSERWGPRVMDVDIILWGSLTLESEGLIVPHPEFRKRAFVLVPLAEIAPNAVDPLTGKTVAELAADASVEGRVGRKMKLEV
ncbi:MAG: 2-amino-4-hydroxy-6-hydroxymethyldihydropteridine diphosphokinase [Candidatus Hydrogenedentes bacterium]|nr:2-amino-4-hydroxy-6-hydroxymethyldihydropteridine diphosphokinase [Candidatus Hydrogenedentota bacterium]